MDGTKCAAIGIAHFYCINRSASLDVEAVSLRSYYDTIVVEAADVVGAA